MRLTSRDEENLALIYECFVLKEDLDVGGVVGGSPTSSGPDVFPNPDGYATGDNRIPKVIGKVQTRKGPLKKKRKKRKDSGVPRIDSISDMGPL